MISSVHAILHACLQQCPAEEREQLLGFLKLPERQIVATTQTQGNPLESQESVSKLLERIHSSWFSPFLRTLSERGIGLFLNVLSAEKAHLIASEILYASDKQKEIHLSPAGKTFLQTTLVQYLTSDIDDLLPAECLPPSPLNELLEMPTSAVHDIADLLGVRDLAVEISQVIDKGKFKKIHESLTSQQQAYLRGVTHEPVIFTPMGLAHWTEDQEKLQALVQERGLNRLAKALYGQNSSLVWYVLHRLDVKRALVVSNLSKPLDHQRAHEALVEQVAALIQTSAAGPA